MAEKNELHVTPAIRALRAAGVVFTHHNYAYEEKGGTAVSARELGEDEHHILKTLVLEDDRKQPLLCLMHGDREVSLRGLARVIGARSVAMCSADAATKHTGYLFGGTSPFGTRKPLPVYAHTGIEALERVLINGGKRGFLVALPTRELVRVLGPIFADVAAPAVTG